MINYTSQLRYNNYRQVCTKQGFPGGAGGKASACHTGDPGLICGSGRSPGRGNGNPLQYSCLENSMDRGAWACCSPQDYKEPDTTEAT